MIRIQAAIPIASPAIFRAEKNGFFHRDRQAVLT
jgi:hypothetical protein